MVLYYFGGGWEANSVTQFDFLYSGSSDRDWLFMEARVAVQNAALSLGMGNTSVGAWRSRTLAILLMAVIGTIFWVDSRYPALMKRYHAGTGVSAKGALTFGSVYAVDRT